MVYWISHSRTAGTALPRRAVVRFTGDVERRDFPALEALGLDLAPLTRVHVDLGGLDFAGVTLASWLMTRRQAIGDVGGRLTLGRMPRRFDRVLRALDLSHLFEIVGAAGGDSSRRARVVPAPRPAPGARLAAASP